jgi:ketosteroid isomerase-like protein
VSEGNVELARRGWEAAARGDFDLIASLLDPEVKWHGGDPSAAGSCQNRTQALQWMQRVRRPMPELVDVREAGDSVVLILKPPVAEGEEPVLTANVTTFRDGKVVEMVHYDRATDALAALGLSS